jgi:hypothetical protein
MIIAGYAQSVRAKLDELHIQQSLQLARLCDVKGQPSVYVCVCVCVRV